MTVEKDRLFKKLEHVGEFVVRENLAKGVYGPNRRPLVEEWLEQFDEEEEQEEVLEEAVAEEPEQAEAESLASEPSEEPEADASPPKKWYQRLFGIGRKDT